MAGWPHWAAPIVRAVMGNGSGEITAANPLDVNIAGGSGGGTVTVIQPNADLLKADANLQVANADVSNANPVPVSDAGGSLTVDSPQLPAALGGGTSAQSLKVVIASDQVAVATKAAAAAFADGSIVALGAATDTTASVTVIGRLINLLSRWPAALGSAASAASTPVVIASDQVAVATKAAAAAFADGSITNLGAAANTSASTTVMGYLLKLISLLPTALTTEGALKVRTLVSVDSPGVLKVKQVDLAGTPIQIKGTAGVLYGYHIYNANGSTSYIQMFDVAAATTPTLGTDKPDIQLNVGTLAFQIAVPQVVGIPLANGLKIAATTAMNGGTGSGAGVTAIVWYM